MSESAPRLIDLAYVVTCYFDQDNADSLISLLEAYAGYAPELLDRIQFVIVDDASPIPIEIPAGLDLNLRLLRVNENIPWNYGARNLGIVYAQANKILATDLDHRFTEQTLRHLVERRLPHRRMYRFRRLRADGSRRHPGPNIIFMNRGRFLELFGYDEEFAGAYCCEDGSFWRWQRYNGTRFGYLPQRYAVHEREVDRDRSYHSLDRDKTRNTAMKHRKIREWARWGARGGHSHRFLEFSWRTVEDRRRQAPTFQPPEDPLWKKLWFLRQIF